MNHPCAAQVWDATVAEEEAALARAALDHGAGLKDAEGVEADEATGVESARAAARARWTKAKLGVMGRLKFEAAGRARRAREGALDASLQSAAKATSSKLRAKLRRVSQVVAEDAARKLKVVRCVEINHWFGASPPNFRNL